MTRQAPWLFVCAVMVSGFFVVAQIYAVLPLLGGIAADLRITGAQVSFIPTAFGLAYAAGFLVFGPIADRMDRMTLLVVGLVALAIASAWVARAHDYEGLVSGRILQGLAASSFPATALALVSQRMPRQHQPLAISMLGFAFLSSAPLSQAMVDASGLVFGRLMAWSSVLYLLCAVATLVTGSKMTGGGPGAGAPAAAIHVNPQAAQRLPPLAALTIAPGSVLFGFVSFHALCQSLAQADSAIEPQLLRLAGFPPLLLCFAAPQITRRYGPAITACSGLTIVALALTLASVGVSLLLVSMAISAGVSLAVPGLIGVVTFWSGEAVRARSLAAYTFFLFGGASIAPVTAHALFQEGVAPAFALPAVVTFCATAALYMTRTADDPLDTVPGDTRPWSGIR